jgi:hypothetical protein
MSGFAFAAISCMFSGNVANLPTVSMEGSVGQAASRQSLIPMTFCLYDCRRILQFITLRDEFNLQSRWH